jgi:hypothetical protein
VYTWKLLRRDLRLTRIETERIIVDLVNGVLGGSVGRRSDRGSRGRAMRRHRYLAAVVDGSGNVHRLSAVRRSSSAAMRSPCSRRTRSRRRFAPPARIRRWVHAPIGRIDGRRTIPVVTGSADTLGGASTGSSTPCSSVQQPATRTTSATRSRSSDRLW